jgi:hypothetical protein
MTQGFYIPEKLIKFMLWNYQYCFKYLNNCFISPVYLGGDSPEQLINEGTEVIPPCGFFKRVP